MLATSSFAVNKYSRKPFDLDSEADDKELRAWCQIHWQHTICKGINSCNAPTYHDCCISFSKRSCIKKNSHPPLQSASVLKIPSLRSSGSHQELYRWLKERLRFHQRMGKKTFFPTINTAHYDDDDDEYEDPEEKIQMLSKRCEQMVVELEKTKQEMELVRESNKRLVQSSKSWYNKYQELLSQTHDDAPSYAETTPQKAQKSFRSEELIQL